MWKEYLGIKALDEEDLQNKLHELLLVEGSAKKGTQSAITATEVCFFLMDESIPMYSNGKFNS